LETHTCTPETNNTLYVKKKKKKKRNTLTAQQRGKKRETLEDTGAELNLNPYSIHQLLGCH